MANYILVHGGNVSTDTWNASTKRKDYPAGEKLGGKVWHKVVFELESLHHDVYAPTLDDENTHNLSHHIQQICTLIDTKGLENIILVGHSYAGMVITGVAAKRLNQVACLVYVDAALPQPNQSLFDLLEQGGLNPIDVVDAAPMAYTEKLQFDPKKIQSLAKSYIRCTKSDFINVTLLAKNKINADQLGWHYTELPTSHLPMATMVEELVQCLQAFA